MHKRDLVLSALLLTLSGGVAYGLWPQHGMGSRDLGCDKQTGRAQELCRRLEHDMQWTWTGHAIISPGWRVTFVTIARSYCAEHITIDDIPELQILRRSTTDWRAEFGADFLIRLVQSNAGGATEDVTSVLNPTNPSYILKDGCSRATTGAGIDPFA